jgi:sugar lactone lactonase YvrE
MAITPDGRTLVVAESHANRLTAFDIAADGGLVNRRIWAATPGDHPDGICLDADGALWYADVANRHCVRVREGGDVTETIPLDRGAFSCTLSRSGEPTLYVVAQEFGGEPPARRTGQLLAFAAPTPGAGRP